MPGVDAPMVRVLSVSVDKRRRLSTISNIALPVRVVFEVAFPFSKLELAQIVASSMMTSGALLSFSISQALVDASVSEFVVGEVAMNEQPTLFLETRTPTRVSMTVPSTTDAGSMPVQWSEGDITYNTQSASVGVLGVVLGGFVCLAVCLVCCRSVIRRRCKRLLEEEEEKDQESEGEDNPDDSYDQNKTAVSPASCSKSPNERGAPGADRSGRSRAVIMPASDGGSPRSGNAFTSDRSRSNSPSPRSAGGAPSEGDRLGRVRAARSPAYQNPIQVLVTSRSNAVPAASRGSSPAAAHLAGAAGSRLRPPGAPERERGRAAPRVVREEASQQQVAALPPPSGLALADFADGTGIVIDLDALQILALDQVSDE
eukprot:CAMPEP_0177199696 /NCGR_PEP_ID=MMETSP0367-20130122/25814_1 /TAXON_ID=447022 ORGANISM="Scrippsiella hangoei-like, Strain SHHI-4" /NCGR_SAMPLE_ID=MMETSP0367 /ASSEMBLY_ACC=CAM_ASM_000362 /LENGTH=371 /DNA_ID=CAMNT_0018648067 /DNA_START=174 /DNA_END=1289 /DNA_ORIENTATION=-